MGSLMSGWDSNVSDPRTDLYERNRSLTRDEIDTFWKSKKQQEDEHTEVVSKEFGTVKSSEKSYPRSSSLPLSNTKERFLDMETDEDEVSLKKLILKNGWWTSSSSAFLNDPPVISEEGENRYSKYAAQFHVADMDASKPLHARTGINTSLIG